MKTEIKFISYIEDSEWNHFSWTVKINGFSFQYKTGIGHRTDFKKKAYPFVSNKKPAKSANVSEAECWAHIPEIDDVLESLFMDASSGNESFNEFCANCDYSTDSIKAFEVYRACMKNESKLRKALGKEYDFERNRIAERNS